MARAASPVAAVVRGTGLDAGSTDADGRRGSAAARAQGRRRARGGRIGGERGGHRKAAPGGLCRPASGADCRPADPDRTSRRERRLPGAAPAPLPDLPGLGAGEETAALDTQRDLAGYPARVGLDQRGDRTGLGHRRSAAPADAQALRPALVARAGPRAGIGADQSVRVGAGAEETGPLRPHRPGGGTRHLRAPGAGDRRDQHPCRFRRRQPEDAGAGARGGSQAAPCRYRRR